MTSDSANTGPVPPSTSEARERRYSDDRVRSLVDVTRQIIWTANPDGEFVTPQRRWSDFTGQSFEEYRGKGWLEAVHPDDRTHAAEAWSSSLQERTARTVEYRVRGPDGDYRWFAVAAVPVLEADGSVREWVGTGTDVTVAKEAEAVREQARDEVARISMERDAVLDQIAEGVIFTDTEGIITFVNAAASRLHGVAELAVSVKDYTKTYRLLTMQGDPYPPEDLPLARAVLHGETVADAQWRIRHPNGLEIIAQGSATPVVADDGVGIGAVLTFRDVTEQVEARKVVEKQTAELTAQADELQAQAAQLDEVQVELEMTNDALERTNTQLAARTREAEEAQGAAQAANRSKSEFLANMSHEIRTPINAIVGYTDLLDLGLKGALTEGQQSYIARVKSSSMHLIGLVNEVLDLAKMEAGQVEVERVPTPLLGTAGTALAMVVPQANAKGIEIREESDCERGTMYIGDEARVRQIVVNMLSNAVKFTNSGGEITVRYLRVDDPAPEAELDANAGPWIVVEVQDTGIGIAPEELGRVFEPFTQVDSKNTREQGGTGLGLTISRKFARLMGGDLTVQSELGVGSCFTLWLCAATAAHASTAHDS
jgi:PAS domain S-box-containing protein